MKQIVFLILLLCVPSLSFGQGFKECEVYQYSGKDSSKQKLAKKIIYNKAGRVVSEKNLDFYLSPSTSLGDGTTYYFYKDTLLVKEIFINARKENDSVKIVYSHNDLGKRISQEVFIFERLLRKEADKDLGRPRGCVVTDEDFEKERTWKKLSETSFSYNSKGYLAEELNFFPIRNRKTSTKWFYNSNGELIEEHYFDDNLLQCISRFTYYKLGKKMVRTWYEEDGTPKHLNEKSAQFYPEQTFAYKLDPKGKVIEERITDHKNNLLQESFFFYNTNGQLSKEVIRIIGDSPNLTHIYRYK